RSGYALRHQLFQQRLRLFQIARVKPLRKPSAYRGEQFAGLPPLTLVTPEAREAHSGAEFPGLGVLSASDRESTFKILFRLHGVALRRNQSDFPCYTRYVGLAPFFLRCFYRLDGFLDAASSFLEISKFRMRVR